MADESKSRYSSGKFDAAKYYAEFRSGMFGDGWKSDATTSHEHVEALEATVSAALNVAGEILASRSEQQPKWVARGKKWTNEGDYVFLRGRRFQKRGVSAYDATGECFTYEVPPLPQPHERN